MPATTKWGIRYPDLNLDAPNGPTQIQNLATDTDTALTKVAGQVQGKFFPFVLLSSTGVATVEHGLGWKPTAVVVTPSAPIGGGAAAQIFAMAMVDSLTATTFRIKGLNADATYVVGTVSFSAMFFQ